MIGRHKFRLMHINTAFITSIVKDIDTPIFTIHRTRVTLREMILNLPSYEKKLGPNKLFLSIDYTANNSDIWFKKKKGLGRAGYILSYYEWDEGEAIETLAGLGEYVGHYYGRDHVYAYFSADHWTATQRWVWNSATGKMDTPNQRHLAANVLHDPTAEVMEAYNAKQEMDSRLLLVQEAAAEAEGPNDAASATNHSTSSQRDATVSNLALRNVETQDEAFGLVRQLNPQLAAEAKAIAQTIHAASRQVLKNSYDTEDFMEEDREHSAAAASAAFCEEDNEDDKKLSAAELHSHKLRAAQDRARHILQAELDPDLSSIPDSDEHTRKVNNVVFLEEGSVSSDVTDITDNTENKDYHHEMAENNANENNHTASDQSIGTDKSITSFNSIRTVDLNKIIKADMSEEEKARNITATLKLYQLRAQQTADRLLESLKKGRQKDSETSESSINEKSSTQLTSDCDTGGKE